MNRLSAQDAADEALIQSKGKTAPRVTPADIAANIIDEVYFTAEQGYQRSNEDSGIPAGAYGQLKLLTFCVLVLRSGFTVTGESACASPENFDSEIGRKIARDNAVQKVWSLMGYALKEQLARQKPWACASCCGHFGEMPTVCPHSTDGANGCNALLAKSK